MFAFLEENADSEVYCLLPALPRRRRCFFVRTNTCFWQKGPSVKSGIWSSETTSFALLLFHTPVSHSRRINPKAIIHNHISRYTHSIYNHVIMYVDIYLYIYTPGIFQYIERYGICHMSRLVDVQKDGVNKTRLPDSRFNAKMFLQEVAQLCRLGLTTVIERYLRCANHCKPHKKPEPEDDFG